MIVDDLSVEELRHEALDLYKQNQEMASRIHKLELELYELRQLLAGHRSEKNKTITGVEQTTLFDQEDCAQQDIEQEEDQNGGHTLKMTTS